MDSFYLKSLLLSAVIGTGALAQKLEGVHGTEWLVTRNGEKVFRIVTDQSGAIKCVSGVDIKSKTVERIGRHPINNENYEVSPTLANAKPGEIAKPRITQNNDYLIVTGKDGKEIGKWFAQGNIFTVNPIKNTDDTCKK